MAAALFNAAADPEKARAISAGTQPGVYVHPEVLQTMRELDIDLTNAKPTLLTDDLAASASMLITMGCGEACPAIVGPVREDWPLDDPKGRALDDVRRIREEVRERVRDLVARQGWG